MNRDGFLGVVVGGALAAGLVAALVLSGSGSGLDTSRPPLHEAWVPADATGVMTVEVGGWLAELTDLYLGLPLGTTPYAEFQSELDALTQKHYGIEFSEASRLTAFVSVSEQAVAVIASGVKLDAERLESTDLGPGIGRLSKLGNRPIPDEIYAAGAGDDVLVLGNAKGVLSALAAHAGERVSLAEADSALGLRRVLDRLGGGQVVVAAQLSGLGLALGEMFPPLAGVEAQGLRLRSSGAGRSTVVASTLGDAEALSFVKIQLEAGMALVPMGLEAAMAQAPAGAEPEVEIGMLFAKAGWDAFQRNLQIRQEGEFFELELATIDGVLSVGTLGVLSAVAVPAFIKYIRRAKTTEALDVLDRIARSATEHYVQSGGDGGGEAAACAFPPSAPLTPEGWACDYSDERFPGEAAAWAAAGWKALGFELTTPHYFQYAFESEGTGADATFTATAYGDLDCDGIKSTFQRIGYGNADCTARLAPIFIENETE